MRILIIGAGMVGYYLSERFSSEGHDVVLIDSDEEKLRKMEKYLDVLTIHGSGASAHVLEQAGVQNADLFIAVTDVDEVNIVACMLAKEYGVKSRVARVRNEDFFSADAPLNQQRFSLDLMINPDRVMTEEIVRLSDLSEALDVIDFSQGKVEVVSYRIDKKNPVCGKSLIQIGKLRKNLKFVVVAVIRGDVTIIPRGEDVLLCDDRIYLVASREDIQDIERMLNIRSHVAKKVFIVGGGRLGHLIAQELEKRNIDVRIIESDKDRCIELSESLGKCLVLNCDGLESQDLLEEGIGQADLVIAVTGSDTTNLMTSLLAKHHGARKCITKIQQGDFVPLLGKLGIDVALSPRLLVARTILRFVRRGAILSVATILGSDSEVLEMVVPDKETICRIPLMKLEFPVGADIGAIIREGKLIVPRGSSIFMPGDEVVVFALKKAVVNVERFFSS